MEVLRSLAKLINDSVQQIDESCARRGVTFPSLEDPSAPADDVVYDDPVVKQAVANIVGASAQLTATVRTPYENIAVEISQVH